MSGATKTDASPRPAAGTAATTESSTGRLILRMLALAWRYKGAVLLILLMQSALLAMAMGGLGLCGLGIDTLKAAVENRPQPRWPLGIEPPTAWSPMIRVGVIGGVVFLIAAVRFLLDYRNSVTLGRLVQDVVVDLRAAVYDKLQRLSFRFYDANESGSIINRVTGDVQSVRLFVDQVLIQVVLMLISLSFFLTYMVGIHPLLTAACLATTPVLWFLTLSFSRLVKPAYRKNRDLYDVTVRTLSENVLGVHVVKGFGLQQQQIEAFDRANLAVRDQKRWIFRVGSVFSPLIQFVPQLNLVVLLCYGGYLHVQNPAVLSFGTLIVFAGLLQQFSTQVGNVAQLSNSVQQALIGAQRVFEVLDTPVEIQNKPDAKPLQRAKGKVEFDHVSFGYGKSEADHVLNDVSLKVEPGVCVALLGATGAGKSTMLSLIPRFYDVGRGRVLLDDIDVRDLDLDDLRRSVGLVFQESFLFSNTIAANIAFGHPAATRQQVEKAAKIASADGFIRELPRGYDTLVGERGSNLSGGQRQRLAIARAVLLEPPILLLDDPTAAIDPETEHEILEAMDSAMRGRTTFIVAHRLSTLRRADLVVVLDKGRIVEWGTHEQLMDTRGVYRRAASLQIADDESRRLLGLSGK